jgi:hypothetical protein
MLLLLLLLHACMDRPADMNLQRLLLLLRACVRSWLLT